jgi:hypothetical protein
VRNRDQWIYLFLMMGHVQKLRIFFESRGEETEINGDF